MSGTLPFDKDDNVVHVGDAAAQTRHFGNPDFVRYAESYGAQGSRVNGSSGSQLQSDYPPALASNLLPHLQ